MIDKKTEKNMIFRREEHFFIEISCSLSHRHFTAVNIIITFHAISTIGHEFINGNLFTQYTA
jgi:hypothetical protein